jgi:hypothetical protein
MKVKTVLNALLMTSLTLGMVITGSTAIASQGGTPISGSPLSAESPLHAEPIENQPPPGNGDDDQSTDLPKGVSDDWWSQVQDDIQQAEYHISWQESTYLADLTAAFQAPNRAHDLRTYFTPQGIRLIPRSEETPPWQLGLSLLGYGPPGEMLQVEDAVLQPNHNYIEYLRGGLAEWYLNDERGLEQGFTIPASLSSNDRLLIELEITGNLTPVLIDGGSGVEFTNADGTPILNYGELRVSDSSGQVVSIGLELLSSETAGDSPGTILRMTIPPHDDTLTFSARLISLVNKANTPDGLPTTYDWSAGLGQASWFGWSVSTAGDVNGDGYSDVIISAPWYDEDGEIKGKVFVWHGGEGGLGDPSNPNWEVVGENGGDFFGLSVNTAGDVNGDGFEDIIVGAYGHDNGETDEGAAYVWHGSSTGLGDPLIWNWKAEGGKDNTGFGYSVSDAGDVNGDGYSDVIIGAPYYDRDGVDRGKVWVWHGSGAGLGDPTLPNWWAEGEHGGAHFGWSVNTAGDVNGDGFSDIIVGARYYSYGQLNEGAAYVWHGGQGDKDDLGDSNRPANWMAESDKAHTDFGSSVSTAGDVNSDGFSDIIIGASFYDNGQPDEGAAFAWYGSEGGLGPQNDTIASADWMVEGEQASAHLGGSVGTAGDVNGDGFSDIIVGALNFDAGQIDEGAAFVWYGSDEGLGISNRSADWTAEGNESGGFGGSVGTAGDVNGDTYSDIIVGGFVFPQPGGGAGMIFVYHGSHGGPILSLTWTAEGDHVFGQFGFSVSTAGDVNADGYSDIIVGAPYFDANGLDSGKVFVWYGEVGGLGSPNNPDWEAVGENANDWFGWAVAGAGDVNGDGHSDIIIGAFRYPDIYTENGAAYVWHGGDGGLGNPGTADWKVESPKPSAGLGFTVGTAGDVNNDGFSDVIIGSPFYEPSTDPVEQRGKVWVWYGSDTGLGPQEDTSDTADWSAEGQNAGDHFAWSVDTAGDVNGDGFSDIIVGAKYYHVDQAYEGAAYVWHGGQGDDDDLGESDRIADWMAESNKVNTDFGFSVSTAGDINGDGYSDILVAAPWYENDLNDEGAVFAWYGSESGLGPTNDTITSADWMVEGDQANAHFGHSVSTAGDLNGDGFSDIIIGMKYFNRGQIYEGAAFVWYGSAGGLGPQVDTIDSADWMAESNRINTDFGIAVSVAGDVNGDGYSDVIVGAPGLDKPEGDEGGAFVYLGSSQGLSGDIEPSYEGDQGGAQFGYSVDGGGDINGDGYADIIVGAPYYDIGEGGEGKVYVFQGSASGLITSTAWSAEGDQKEAFFGWSVGMAGDVNGDGYGDIIVGTPYYDQDEVNKGNEGAVFVWYSSKKGLGPSGTPANADWTVESDQKSAFFGWVVSNAGDVNGDGYSDIIIGAPGYDNGQDDEGRAHLYLGSGEGLSSSPDWTDEGDQVDAGYGNAVGTAGDINGDGYSDVIVGADQYDNGQVDEGRAYVYYGSQTGLAANPVWRAESNQVKARFGCSVSSAGDVTDDGYADIVVGACRYEYHPQNLDEGAAFVWYGSTNGLGANGNPLNASWMALGDQKNAQYGFAVDSAGDVNGDGIADIIVGAPYYDTGPNNDGAAFVYHGAHTGLSPTSRWSGDGGDIASVQFGYSVSGAGDVNGDGYADVIVGAPFHDFTDDVFPTVPDVGMVRLYTGNGWESLDRLPRQLRTDNSPLPQLGISDSTTGIRLSLLGRMPLGRNDVKLQWQVAPLGEPFTGTSVIEGTSAAWIDTGTDGASIIQQVDGLTEGTTYHWRVRLIYTPGNRLGQTASRWVHIPWDGWDQLDFRTQSETSKIYLPIINK